jgi:tripartite-type tricarboxylate transporter receptor subunit TctC
MRRSVVLVVLLAVLAVPVLAAAYPTKPVELIVPWAAGGRADLIARLFAAAAGKHLGQSMVVVNKPGGGGATGTVGVANAPADGHTLLAATIGGNVLRPLSTTLPYRYDSFAPVGQITVSTMVLAANASRPWKNLRELVEAAKKAQTPPTYGCPFGVVPHLAVIAVGNQGGVELRHVPQQGDGPSITATLGGHQDMLIGSPATLLPHIKTGALRALATFGTERDPFLPDVPTAREQGFPVIAAPWTGIAAPKATPPEVLAKLRLVFEAVLKDPEFVAGMEKLGERIVPVVGEPFAAQWKRDHEQWEAPSKALKKPS